MSTNPIPSPDAARARDGVVEPADPAELADILARCGAEGKTVELGGRFTKHSMGGAVWPADVVISTARMSRVVEYEPRDLTISVEAGLNVAMLNELLKDGLDKNVTPFVFLEVDILDEFFVVGLGIYEADFYLREQN